MLVYGLALMRSTVRLVIVLSMSLMSFVSFAQQAVTITVLDANGAPLPHAVVSVTGNAQAPQTRAIMDQIDVAFEPHVLAVPVGSQVLFPNSDNIRHHVYSFSSAKTFETKLYANESRPTIDFDRPGIVALGCNIHDQMSGYIYVSPHAQSVVSDANGRVRVALAGADSVLVWHPWLQEQNRDQQEIAVDSSLTEVSITLAVTAPSAVEEPRSRLQDRFRRRGTND